MIASSDGNSHRSIPACRRVAQMVLECRDRSWRIQRHAFHGVHRRENRIEPSWLRGMPGNVVADQILSLGKMLVRQQ